MEDTHKWTPEEHERVRNQMHALLRTLYEITGQSHHITVRTDDRQIKEFKQHRLVLPNAGTMLWGES